VTRTVYEHEIQVTDVSVSKNAKRRFLVQVPSRPRYYVEVVNELIADTADNSAFDLIKYLKRRACEFYKLTFLETEETKR